MSTKRKEFSPQERQPQLMKPTETKKTKTEKEIKIILIISGHGSCETIVCKDNICELTGENEQSTCIIDKEKPNLHNCADATSSFHMSVYTKDIKLYSYAPYGYFNWNKQLSLLTDSNGNGLYYNDFSRIYNVNREIEATINTINDNYDELMVNVSRQINDPRYIEPFKQMNKKCFEIEFSNKSIVKEVYKFEDVYRSDDLLFTQLKKPEKIDINWSSWFWSWLGYQTHLLAPATHPNYIAPKVIFSGIFVAKTNKPKNFGTGQKLLPSVTNTNYNCDFTLFSHIREIGGKPLCILISNYIMYWNHYIEINTEFIVCVKIINTIEWIYDNKLDNDLSKITRINNESLYHIVNIILNFNIPDSPLIKAFLSYFAIFKSDKLDDKKYIEKFKSLLNEICDLFNVELHLISNACRGIEQPVMPAHLKDIKTPYTEEKIQELQKNIHNCLESSTAGGKKTRKRKCRRTKKRRRVHKRYI